MKYPAFAIANYFLSKAQSCGEQLTPLKLIKLVYLAHGWSSAITNEPITEYAPVNTAKTNNLDNDPVTAALLDRIWDVYGGYSAIELANLTHEADSSWDQTWNKQGGRPGYNLPVSREEKTIMPTHHTDLVATKKDILDKIPSSIPDTMTLETCQWLNEEEEELVIQYLQAQLDDLKSSFYSINRLIIGIFALMLLWAMVALGFSACQALLP